MTTFFTSPLSYLQYVIMLLVCVSLAGIAKAQNESGVLAGPLQGSDVRTYIQNVKLVDQDATLVTAKDLDNQTVLRVTYDNRTFITFRPVPIKATTIAQLTFKARWNNQETIENNPSLEAAIEVPRLNQAEVLPAALVEFLDADQKLLAGSSFIMLLHGQWQDYLMRFQTPPNAAFIQLKVTSGRNDGQLFLASPRLTSQAQPQTSQTTVLNFKPDQSNVCGNVFGITLDQRIQKNTEGTLYVVSGSDTRTDSIVIGPPGNYQLKADIVDAGASSSTRIYFMDINDKLVGTVGVPAGDAPFLFTLPENATAVRFRITYKLLSEIRIEPAVN